MIKIKKDILEMFLAIALIFFTITVFVPTVSATDIYVPDDYPTVQDAINVASVDDVIIVRDRAYIENINISGNLTAWDGKATINGTENPVVLFVIPNEIKVTFMVGEEFWELKTEFQIGEWVGLTLEGEELRGGDHPAIANDTTFVISDEAGNIIWNKSVGKVGEGWSSGPGGGWGVGVSWGQVDMSGDPVPAGNYTAGVIFTDPTFNFSEDFSGVIPLTVIDITTSPPEGWSEDIRLTDNRTALDSPSVTVDSDNNVHMLWTDSRDGSWNLYYMKLDSNGDKLIDDTKMTPGACYQFTECGRQIAADSQGNVHIVWRNNRAISYMKLDNKGNVIIAGKSIGGGGSPYSCYPSIAIDSNDNIHVIFNKRLDEVSYVKLDNNGNVLKTIRVDGWGSYTSAIAMDSKNNVHLTWLNSGIKYAKFDNNGNKLVDNLKVSDIYKSDETQSAIATDSADNVHIIWNTNTQIYYAKLDRSGNVITTDKLVSNITGAWGYSYISTDIDTKDNLNVVWQDRRDGNSEIYYKRLDSNGNCLSTDIRLTSYGGASMSPSIIVDSNNKVHISWYDNRHGFSDIYYKYSEAPNTISCDASGNEKNQFAPEQGVYVKANRLAASTDYKIWIQDDPVNEDKGLNISEDPSGSQEIVTTNEFGIFAPILIWSIPPGEPVTHHEYDIVVDKQNDGVNTGKYNAVSDGIDSATAVGFVAPVPELSTIISFSVGLLTLIGYFRLRRRRNA